MSEVTLRSQLELARKQIEFARGYTLGLIEDVAEDDWFSIPAGASSHVGWQVGHLAMAQYGLCLFRIRGRQPHDTELMSSSFRKCFMKGSQPKAGAESNPTPEEIREVLDRVHRQSLLEMADYDESTLAEEVEAPFAAYNNKLGSILFCPAHEMLHAGQIGMLRRMLGKSPLR